jgi:flavoprotein hydroxylase
MATEVDADVAIVGAGPVGLVLAILLGQCGRSVVVLERWPEPYALPRAVHFDHEVGRILQSCGLGDELRAVSEPAEIYEWRNAAGTTLLRFGRIGFSRSGWPESSMFCQPEVEALLGARAASLPTVEVYNGFKFQGKSL